MPADSWLLHDALVALVSGTLRPRSARTARRGRPGHSAGRGQAPDHERRPRGPAGPDPGRSERCPGRGGRLREIPAGSRQGGRCASHRPSARRTAHACTCSPPTWTGPFVLRHLADLAALVGRLAATWDQMAEPMPGRAGAMALRASRDLLERGALNRASAPWTPSRCAPVASGARSTSSGLPGRRRRIVLAARAQVAQRYRLSMSSPLVAFHCLRRSVRGLWPLVIGRRSMRRLVFRYE